MMLLMILAKGRGVSWTMSQRDLLWLLQMFVPLVVACFGIELWGEVAESRRYITGFIYDTELGYLLIAIDVVLLLVFVSNVFLTHNSERDFTKRLFYKIFGILSAAWFSALPVVGALGVLIA